MAWADRPEQAKLGKPTVPGHVVRMHTVFDFAAKRAELSPDAIAFEEADERPAG